MPNENDPMDRVRIEKLFKQLDTDNNGFISVTELSRALRGTHPDSMKQAAQVIRQGDRDASMTMDLEEFINYVKQQDQKLRLAFAQLDRNQDQQVDAKEIQLSMRDVGLEIDLDEANALLAKMDKDGSSQINYDEWRNYLLLTGHFRCE